MTFQEKYNQETTWHGKATIMEIYHLAMLVRDKNWTLTQTATEFSVSIGLVSENLRLASEIHNNPKILTCKSRQEALNKLRWSQADEDYFRFGSRYPGQ